MREVFEIMGWFAALFGASLAVSWTLASLISRARRRVDVPENSVVRIRADGAMYRSRLLKADKEGWVLAAPLQRDAHVPLRVGERLTVDCPTPKGLLRFRTEIVERVASDHTMRLAPPPQAFLIERRQSKRVVIEPPETVLVEGREGAMLDVSELGARVWLSVRVSRGERVRLEGPRLPSATYAWVMEALPGRPPRADGALVRLRFEELFPLETFARR